MNLKGEKPSQGRFRSPVLESAHGLAAALHRSNLIDRQTMREFDVECLTQVEDLGPDQIKDIRSTADMSQGVFALVLNVSKDQVSKWERGEKRPSGPSLKLLNLAKKNGIDAIL